METRALNRGAFKPKKSTGEGRGARNQRHQFIIRRHIFVFRKSTHTHTHTHTHTPLKGEGKIKAINQ